MTGAFTPSERVVSLRALDGLHLFGTLLIQKGRPSGPSSSSMVAALLARKTASSRAWRLGWARRAWPRCAMTFADTVRARGRQEGSSLTAHLNDMRVALAELRERTGAHQVNLLAAGFTGGLAAYYAARRPTELARLVLINPLFDYKERFVDQKPYWHDDYLDDGHALRLRDDGYLAHSPTFRLGRAMLNDVFWVEPRDVVHKITAPTLIIHGTQDTFISIESSRSAVPLFRAEHRLVEIDGAEHGIAVHDDPQYLNPQTQEWQAFVVRTVAEWIKDPLAADT
jgi:uncharacterized protein